MRFLAFMVHVLTACGAALALLALLAAARGDWATMFLWLGGALAIDAVDGPLARTIKVSEQLPRWSGEMLDFVVDYTTYVFVPAFAIATARLMPDAGAVLAAALVAVTAAIYFADRNMKTAANYFCGFPVVWNLIAFYLLLLRPPAAMCAAIIVVFAVLTFVPIRFVHPIRVRRWRALTVTLLVLWALLALLAVLQDLTPGPWVTVTLCLIAVYFALVGLIPASRDPI